MNIPVTPGTVFFHPPLFFTICLNFFLWNQAYIYTPVQVLLVNILRLISFQKITLHCAWLFYLWNQAYINASVQVLLEHILRLITCAFSIHFISNVAQKEDLLINRCKFHQINVCWSKYVLWSQLPFWNYDKGLFCYLDFGPTPSLKIITKYEENNINLR